MKDQEPKSKFQKEPGSDRMFVPACETPIHAFLAVQAPTAEIKKEKQEPAKRK